jgi:hypothetical protein
MPRKKNLTEQKSEISEQESKTESKKEEQEQPVKVPKKRGRKPKPKVENAEPKIPKKRGRKPKPKDENAEPKVPKKRGRKPKKFGLVATEPQNDVTSIINDKVILHLPISPEDKNITSYLENDFYTYKSKLGVPIGYDENTYDKYISHPKPLDLDSINNNTTNDTTNSENNAVVNAENEQKIYNQIIDGGNNMIEPNNENANQDTSDMEGDKETQKTQETQEAQEKDDKIVSSDDTPNNIKLEPASIVYDTSNPELLKIKKEILNNRVIKGNVSNIKSGQKNQDTMIQFREANKNYSVPKSTNIYCWWDRHSFNWVPCVLPYKLTSGVFHVKGCFCSPECAAAYNFQSGVSYDEIWENFSLLNSFYYRLYCKNKIKIKKALDWKCLKVYGGSKTIDEFRMYNNHYYRDIKYNIPPLISSIPKLEEYNSDIVTPSTGYGMGGQVPMEKLRIYRKTPLNDKNTLKQFMNVSYMEAPISDEGDNKKETMASIFT